MGSIPLANSDRQRLTAQEAYVFLRNRFVEANPVLADNVPAFIQRPALRFWQFVGDAGPIRMVFSQPGAFNDDLFVVAFNSIYRVDRLTWSATLLDNTLFGGDTNDAVRVCCTGDVGTVGPHLWFADGRTLRVYLDNGFATGNFTAPLGFTHDEVTQVGTTYYKFVLANVDTGSPAGTLANPWKVLIGAVNLDTFTNFFNALNDTGINGVDYSTALVANTDVLATTATATGVTVRAIATGIGGNSVATIITSGTDIFWDNTTLIGGGSPGVIPVVLPDGVGCIDVGMINSYVVVIPAQGHGVNGRFYWVNPAETTIDPLDFATAERSADPVYQCVVFGDQFYLPGQDTLEVYYMTGNPDSPVARAQGILFDYGVVPGCAIKVNDFMIMLDGNGSVFKVQGGAQRVSTPAIAEIFRKAIAKRNFLLG